MRKRLAYLVIGLLGGLCACANPNIGKQFSPHQSFTDTSGHHVFMYGVMKMEYDYRIDRTQNKLILDGIIRFMGEVKGGLHEMPLVRIEFYFLDSNHTCVRVGKTSIKSYRGTDSPVTFKRSFPYDPRYRYVNCRPHITYWIHM